MVELMRRNTFFTRVLVFGFIISFAALSGTSTIFAQGRDMNRIELSYSIGPGDVIEVTVWKEPDFSGTFTVRLDGKITIPLLGDVASSGRTPEELSDHLKIELARYIESPQVTVAVVETRSARYFVLGKVAIQGEFPYSGPTRVVQALAMAGGFLDFAKLDKIFVLREVEDGDLVYYRVNYKQLVDDRSLEVNILILPGDTIIVP